MRRTLGILVVVSLAAGAGAAAAKAAKAKPKAKAPAAPAIDPAEVLDVSAIRDKLVLVTDGKGHYVAAQPDLGEDPWRGQFFYSGDGKHFYQQRVGGFGSSGAGNYSLTFWEPRVRDGWRRSLDKKADVFTLQCDDRNTALTVVPAAEAKALLDAATFLKPRWKHWAYALARDERGVYYFVDQPREPKGSKAFRLYRGPKGALKPLKMTNVVSDSEGDIFATKGGELRLIFNRDKGGEGREPIWVQGKKKLQLTWVPVEDNGQLIYMELGVYAGQALGTPCDDL